MHLQPKRNTRAVDRCAPREQAHGHGGERPFAFASSPPSLRHGTVRFHDRAPRARDLAFDFAKKRIKGSAALTLKRVDPPTAHAVTLDAGSRSRSRRRRSRDKDLKYTLRRAASSRASSPKGSTRGSSRSTVGATPGRGKGLYFLEPEAHVATAAAPGVDPCRKRTRATSSRATTSLTSR